MYVTVAVALGLTQPSDKICKFHFIVCFFLLSFFDSNFMDTFCFLVESSDDFQTQAKKQRYKGKRFLYSSQDYIFNLSPYDYDIQD